MLGMIRRARHRLFSLIRRSYTDHLHSGRSFKAAATALGSILRCRLEYVVHHIFETAGKILSNGWRVRPVVPELFFPIFWPAGTQQWTSRAFRKSITSRLARLASANPNNHGGFVVWEGRNNLVHIYEMNY